MKQYAITILVVIILTVIFQPFVEMLEVMVEKARVDAAVRNAGRYAVLTGVDESNRSNINSKLEENKFKEKFNEIFKSALELNESANVDPLRTKFYSLTDKFNDFDVELVFNEIIDPVTGESQNYCRVKATTKYKYKTKYLMLAQSEYPDFTELNINSEQTFPIKIVN